MILYIQIKITHMYSLFSIYKYLITINFKYIDNYIILCYYLPNDVNLYTF